MIPLRTIAYRKVVSLTQAIAPEMPCWPGDPPLELETVAELGREGYGLRRFALGEHSGTHVNAPNSFLANGAAIDAPAADHWVVPAIVLDGRDRAAADPDWQVTVEDLEAWEAQHGTIPPDHLVILWTGWQDRWGDGAAFLNADGDDILHFPGFSEEAVAWLLGDRAIAGLGTDTHGIDPGTSTTYGANRQILAAGGRVVECLTRLDQLPPVGATLVIGVLPLVGGTGSPASVLAFVP